MTPILGVHYIIYEQWCDVLSGFIYIRDCTRSLPKKVATSIAEPGAK
jgi:hypothetical protein